MDDMNASEICPVCGWLSTFSHDHKADLSGLDDGPDDHKRRKPFPVSPEVLSEIRRRAWETRREKYGKYGHG